MYDGIYALMCVQASAAARAELVAGNRFENLMADGDFSGDGEYSKLCFLKANELEKEWMRSVAALHEIKFKQINYVYKKAEWK